MGFRGEAFAFDSPASAVAGMIERLGIAQTAQRVESSPLDFARGRILARAAHSDRDSPPFDYSAMDGYALRTADARPGTTFPVVAESRIGNAPPALPPRPSVIRIATGAPIPSGANAVVKREDLIEHEEAGAIAAVTLRRDTTLPVRPGDHVRRAAENARAGNEIVPAGTILNPAALGALAAVGVTMPLVHPRLRVAVITTGDELVPPDEKPGPFQVRNSNAAALRAILASHPWIEVARCVHARDEDGDAARAIAEAITAADAVILSGGVSMGHRDPVRHAVEHVGAEIVFHGLPQRPGKPMLGAIVRRAHRPDIPVFALPGNPVSTMVTCTRIAVPVLSACAGATRPAGTTFVSVTNPDAKSLDLWWHRLVRLNADRTAELIDARGSGDLIAAARADGFIEVPPGEAFGAGPFAFFPWAN